MVAGPHLHFEVKDRPVLQNPTYFGNTTPTEPSEICPQPPCYWGYTPGLPDQQGYHDPIRFLHSVTPFGPMPLKVTSGEAGCVVDPNPLNVRAGPSTTYRIITSIVVGGQFIAFNRSDDWYQIDLPVSWGGRALSMAGSTGATSERFLPLTRWKLKMPELEG